MGLFNTFVHDPIYNLLVYFYNTLAFQDFGIAIILVTILIKFVFIPLSRKQIESQKQLQEFQPKIKAIQQKYKDDKERQTKELMAFYKENKINPLGGCLPLVVQLVFLFALYRILFGISKGGFTVDPSVLYSFVHNPGTINDFFLGTLNLGIPSIPLAVITAAAQYWQTKTLMQRQAADKEEKKEEKKGDTPDFAQMMSKQMLYLGPGLTLVIGSTFPSGLMLYWLVSTLFMLAQQYSIAKKSKQSPQTRK